ncbi:hypothetical protein F4801DRAFT_590992 [Xylaria longipes]|nr:hypothetical protein F4801DRAFT_590992 [Xylaria longipes]
MATWGGFSRAKTTALVANALLLDGRLVPNSNLDCNNNNNNNNSNNSNGNNNNDTDIASLAYTNTTISTDDFADANANAAATGAGSLDHFLFGGLDVPDIHLDFSLANNTVPSRYSFPPLPSLSDNDSLFATVGDTLSSPFHTTPNTTNFPLLRLGGAFNGALCTASRELPRPLSLVIPPISTPTLTQTLTQTQTPPTLTPALAHQPHHSSFGFPGQFNIPSGGYSGGYHFHASSQNYQFGPQPVIQGSSHNYQPFTTSPLSYFATTPTILSQPHMSNTNIWSNPSLSQAQPPPRAAGVRSIDDYYLTTLATQDFSSPSLPPLSHPTSPTALSLPPRRQSKFVATGQEMPPSSTRRRIARRGGEVDLTKEEPDFDALNSGIDSSIPLATMPATTRRRSLANADASGRKRRPSAATSPSSRPNKTRRKELPIGDGGPCPFGDDDLLGLDGQDGSETIDLSNATEVPAELMAPKVDNRVKIGNFQCVICMDDTTALTVTHCGHLFCSECLHSSLHIDSMKRTCPVCRAKVELKDKNRKTAKSYFHLELKVMTATKKGKRPVGA